MRKNITEDIFNKWKEDLSLPNIFVYVYDWNFKENIIFDLRNYNYLEALHIIEASSNIPIFINPKFLSKEPFYDGGSISPTVGIKVLKTKQKINSFTCIWNRKSPYNAIKSFTPSKVNNIFQILPNYIKRLYLETSILTEELQNSICNQFLIVCENYYTYTEVDSDYDNESDEKLADINNGYNSIT